jgi:exodeoxyribonuclease VII large subunit
MGRSRNCTGKNEPRPLVSRPRSKARTHGVDVGAGPGSHLAVNGRRHSKESGSTLEDIVDEGLQILVEAQVDYHPVYGLKLVVRNIDTSFTEGQLARQRAETIAYLVNEGLWDLNRNLAIPIVIQRIALISNITAAGYADFVQQLESNPYGYDIWVELFPSALQGQAVIDEVPKQLKVIARQADRYDAVAIIRGGGSKMDLSAFDAKEVTEAIARCPIPVITGIGHETDETVSDLIAAIRLKTPTAAAADVIDRMLTYDQQLEETHRRIQWAIRHRWLSIDERMLKLRENIRSAMHYQINREDKRLINHWSNLQAALRNKIEQLDNRFAGYWDKMYTLARHRVEKELSSLRHKEEMIQHSDPSEVLKKGYSLLTYKGIPLKDPAVLKSGDELENYVLQGKISSQFISYESKK